MPATQKSVSKTMLRDQQRGTPRASVQKTSCQASPRLEPSKGECLLFIVYRTECDQRIRNTIVGFSSRIKAYGGKAHGITTKVTAVEASEDSPWLKRNDWCIAVFGFPSQHLARRWYVSEPEVRQYDFPTPSGGVQIFCVPLRYIPQPGRQTFCWTEINHIHNTSRFQCEYVDKVVELLDAKEVNHGLVFVKDTHPDSARPHLSRLKDCCLPPGAYFCLHLYNSEQEFWDLFESGAYRSLTQARQKMCNTTVILFTIEPKIA